MMISLAACKTLSPHLLRVPFMPSPRFAGQRRGSAQQGASQHGLAATRTISGGRLLLSVRHIGPGAVFYSHANLRMTLHLEPCDLVDRQIRKGRSVKYVLGRAYADSRCA